MVKDRVALLRPAYLPVDPASRTSYAPGETCPVRLVVPDDRAAGRVRSDPDREGAAGADDGVGLLAVAVSAADRVPAARDLFDGWWRLIDGLGGVPRLLVWDGEGAVGRYRRDASLLTGECQAFRGTLATKVYVCKPADPEAKGLVERANGYLETSFLPGRRFTSPADFNAQLGEWLALVNTRNRRALGCAPADRIAADRAAMLTLPPVAPATGWRSSTRLARDHYVRLDSNDYSVHPGGDRPADRGHRRPAAGAGFCDGRTVADHERAWAKHQTISDPEHVAAAKLLRGSGSGWCGRRRNPRSRSAAWPTTTRRSVSMTGRSLMPAAKTPARDTTAEIAFLTRALKAPTLRESVDRLAERARAESWTHEEFLVACLQREVSAREPRR